MERAAAALLRGTAEKEGLPELLPGALQPDCPAVPGKLNTPARPYLNNQNFIWRRPAKLRQGIAVAGSVKYWM